jgi:hypothetical protein
MGSGHAFTLTGFEDPSTAGRIHSRFHAFVFQKLEPSESPTFVVWNNREKSWYCLFMNILSPNFSIGCVSPSNSRRSHGFQQLIA